MPNVVRFALASKTEIFVPGVGLIRNGVFDVLQSDTSAVAAVRAALAVYAPTESVVDTSAVVVPPVSLPDPYPQYLTPTDFTSDVAGGTGPLSVALRATFGRAAPVLSNFSYDSTTGNLLSYQEDGITVALTYNADGTVATSKRGTEPTQTYSYSGGNLTGVA